MTTSSRIIRLLFFHTYSEASDLTNVLSEELWRKCRLYGFQSLWTSHLSVSFRFLVSSVRVVPHRLYLLPSYLFLCVLSKRHMMSVYLSLSLAFVLIILLTWHLPLPFLDPHSFFILLKISTLTPKNVTQNDVLTQVKTFNGFRFQNEHTSYASYEECWGNNTREGVRRGGHDECERSEERIKHTHI